jgi:hypothetical protein
MPFEVFTPEAAAESGPAFVSIQKQGIVAFNRAAFAALGEPEAVELLFDRERSLVGLRAADDSLAHTLRVRTSSAGGTYVVSAARFVKHYAIPNEVGRRWAARTEGDVLVIDISQPPVAGG